MKNKKMSLKRAIAVILTVIMVVGATPLIIVADGVHIPDTIYGVVLYDSPEIDLENRDGFFELDAPQTTTPAALTATPTALVSSSVTTTGRRVVKVVSAVDSHRTFAITDDAVLWGWGSNERGQLGDGTTTHRSEPVRIMDNVIYVFARRDRTMVITTDNALWGWGWGYAVPGIGDGTNNLHSSPVRIMENVIAVSGGENHTIALTADNALWGWGGNSTGQVGNGTTTIQHAPVRIMDNVIAFCAGSGVGGSTFAITADNELWGWGSNSMGQLGVGDAMVQHYTRPQKVKDNVIAVRSVAWSTIAITADNALWEWGTVAVGDGSAALHPAPVWVMDGVVSAYSAGFVRHSMSITIDNTLWGWGANQNGYIGDGTTTDRPTPVRVQGDVINVHIADGTTMSITSDNALWGWGNNTFGQIGDGTTINQTAPIRVMDNVLSVSSNGFHTMAITTSGELWGWGSNFRGQLGDGTNTDSLVPIRVVIPDNGGVTPPPDFDNAVELIRTEGTFQYSLWVPNFFYDNLMIYRVQGRVIPNGNTFSIVEGSDTDYLIGFQLGWDLSDLRVGSLVNSPLVLQRAGFMNFFVNETNTSVNERYMVNYRNFMDLQAVRGNYLARFDQEVENGFMMTLFEHTTMLARLVVAGLSSDLAGLAEAGGNMFISRILPNLFPETPSLTNTFSYLHTLYGFAHSDYVSLHQGYINEIRPHDGRWYGHMLNDYNLGVALVRDNHMAQEVVLRAALATKYMHYASAERAIDLLHEVFYGIIEVAGLQFGNLDTFSDYLAMEEHIRGTIRRAIFAVGSITDPDLIDFDNRIVELTEEFDFMIRSNPAYISRWGNAYFHNLPRFDQIISISCPVDVFVYCSNGIRIAEIRNHEVVSTSDVDSATPILVLIGESITILQFPSHLGYRVEITATDYGLMNFAEFRVDTNGDIISRSRTSDLWLENGMELTVNPSHGSDFRIIYNNNQPVSAIISAIATNGGQVIQSADTVAIGEIVSIFAVSYDGFRFSGWYENGVRLPHVEEIYAFTADRNRNLEARFVLDVEISPTVTTATLPNGTIGIAYSQILAATGTTPITWSIASGSLPTGLNLNASTGAIFGTPTVAGTATFSIMATNAAGSDTREFTLTIQAGGGQGGNNNGGGNQGGGGVGATFSLSQRTVTLNDTNLTTSINITGSATGNIAFNRGVLPDAITLTQDGNRIIVSGTRPAHGEATITGTFNVTVTREGINRTLTLNVNLTPLTDVAPIQTPTPEPTQPTPIPTPTPLPIFDNPFDDVNETDWFYNQVAFVYLRRLMTGTAPRQFSPNMTVTRGMVVQVLYNIHGRPEVSYLTNPFTDVGEGRWYHNAVIWAQSNGLVSGFGDGRFAPGDNITRAHLAIILNNYAERMGMELPVMRELALFVDDSDIRNYARAAIERFFQAGIIRGYPDGTFAPQGEATRAELASMLQRFLEVAENA